MTQPTKRGPLPDHLVVLSLVGTVIVCFALAIVAVRHRREEPPLQWRQPTPLRGGAPQALVPIWTA